MITVKLTSDVSAGSSAFHWKRLIKRIKSLINKINIISAAGVQPFSTLLCCSESGSDWLILTAYRDTEKTVVIYPKRKEAPQAEYR